MTKGLNFQTATIGYSEKRLLVQQRTNLPYAAPIQKVFIEAVWVEPYSAYISAWAFHNKLSLLFWMIYYFLNFRHTTGMGVRRHLSFLESEAMKAKAVIIVSRKEKTKVL